MYLPEQMDSTKVEQKDATIIQFPTQSFMQMDQLALKVHVRNLIAAYGDELVFDVFSKLIDMKKVG